LGFDSGLNSGELLPKIYAGPEHRHCNRATAKRAPHL